ncbi:MAG: histidine phosphatase family protein [Burkholderiales bacterium]|nr:phosphoglycerate mutase family protein [Burkholderiales bacterium]MDE1927636.1 histidine phosphatase family protein [Burkholderiales bacterium]MDE2159714.1 histidine phosphatase family protein [Burkholderiales bacterium]MDE2502751.1 histidine phosphatase family protein [Burkholderiales bacterium]
MTELIFIRHGETDWNIRGCFQGQLDVPLNATGQAQAQRLAQRLAPERPDGLYSSDLDRARATAAPLAAAWGLAPTTLPGLREQHFGVLEGLDMASARTRHPEAWARWLEQRADYEIPGGGESRLRFHARVIEAVEALARADAGRRIVVVTHGGVLDMLWREVHGLTLDGQRDCPIPNTGINRLRWADGRLQIEVWGDAAHLA